MLYYSISRIFLGEHFYGVPVSVWDPIPGKIQEFVFQSKILAANQFVGFLGQQYFVNYVMDYFDFLHSATN